mmetsp:Transcript_7510/g.21273  ORF Transcript_7510/g.21273 Transcript_7510/m.21273 type:complete len:499 (+) Transcript_7510:198-1694(+)
MAVPECLAAGRASRTSSKPRRRRARRDDQLGAVAVPKRVLLFMTLGHLLIEASCLRDRDESPMGTGDGVLVMDAAQIVHSHDMRGVTSQHMAAGGDFIKGAHDLARRPQLSSFGRTVSTVVVAALQQEGICRDGVLDWRTSLPRFIAGALLGPDSHVLIWDAHRGARVDDDLPDDCRLCRALSAGPAAEELFSCRAWFRDRNVTSAELVVVLGSGERECPRCRAAAKVVPQGQQFPEVAFCFRQPWVGRDTKLVHLPVSRSDHVQSNGIAPFHVVVKDSDWVKPTHIEDLARYRQTCQQSIPDSHRIGESSNRTLRLVYNARFHGWKGQRAFLERVDPALLDGFRLEFFPAKQPSGSEVERMESIAAARGIDAVVHRHNTTHKELLTAICGAAGAIHYAKTDANPRAAYEPILAGMPLFISRESRVPRVLLRQKFVVSTSFRRGPEDLNKDLAKFLSFLRTTDHADLERSMDNFVQTELEEQHALTKICSKMGICEKW